jgi:ATP-binding cassette, subfamily B, heavy metal transporter
MTRLFDQLRNIGNVFRSLYQSFGESAEMLEILDQPNEIVDHTRQKLKVESGKIEFQDVDFTYDDENAVFQKLSFRIKSGEKIALV